MGERSQLISIQCHPVHQQLLIGQIRFKAALRRDPTEAARPMEANWRVAPIGTRSGNPWISHRVTDWWFRGRRPPSNMERDESINRKGEKNQCGLVRTHRVPWSLSNRIWQWHQQQYEKWTPSRTATIHYNPNTIQLMITQQTNKMAPHEWTVTAEHKHKSTFRLLSVSLCVCQCVHVCVCVCVCVADKSLEILEQRPAFKWGRWRRLEQRRSIIVLGSGSVSRRWGPGAPPAPPCGASHKPTFNHNISR